MNRRFAQSRKGLWLVASPPEALESIAERARRALRDNEAARIQVQMLADNLPDLAEPDAVASSEPAAPPAAGIAPVAGESLPAVTAESWAEWSRLLWERSQAISLVRGLVPQLSCYRQRVQEISQRLGQTTTDSIHYGPQLQRLGEAHLELRRLEERFEGARHTINTTEWLIQLLMDPAQSAK